MSKLGDRRAKIQPILDAEIERWSQKPCDELVSELKDEQNYILEVDGREYHVEVQLLENTETYVHVMVAVDDVSLRISISPSTRTFVQPRMLGAPGPDSGTGETSKPIP